MRENTSCKKIIGCLIAILCIVNILGSPVIVHAASDREALREELDNQENTLRDDIQPVNPLDPKNTKNVYDKAVDIIDSKKVQETANLSLGGKAIVIQKAILEVVIKTRTGAIIIYALTWIIGIIYAATMGSRDVNKRRKVFLVIRNSTVLFFVYINIPLFIIWLNTDKSQLTQITMFNIVYDLIDFLQSKSIVIGCLLAYAGISRLIISRRDLPIRKQGIYLIKFAIISIFFLNIVPIAIYFII